MPATMLSSKYTKMNKIVSILFQFSLMRGTADTNNFRENIFASRRSLNFLQITL